MKCIRPLWAFLRAAGLYGLVFAVSAIGSQAHAEVDALAAELVSVRELMRLETAEAIALARERAAKTGTGKPAATRAKGLAKDDDLRLAGIYGVGRKLLAEIHVGASPMVYMRGHPWPVGTKASSEVYRLRNIDNNCVELERNEQSRSLCIEPSPKGG